MLDQVKTDECDHKVDRVQDDLCDVRIDIDRAEYGGAIVEEVVGTSQLLEGLQGNSEGNSICHPWGLEHVDKFPHRADLDMTFCPELAIDLTQLRSNGPMVCRCAIHLTQRFGCAFNLATTIIKSRCFGEKEDSKTKDRCPDPT